MGLLGVGLSSRLFVSGGEWSIPHVVTQVPARDIMHLLPFWGLALFSFSSLFMLWESEGPWVDTALASWELIGVMMPSPWRTGPGREALQGEEKAQWGDRSRDEGRSHPARMECRACPRAVQEVRLES